jgi:hypothetical protein
MRRRSDNYSFKRNSNYSRRIGFESLERRDMLAVDTWPVTEATDNGTAAPNTLSWAIEQANQTSGIASGDQQKIVFDLSRTQGLTVSISGTLPAITAQIITIDGANSDQSNSGDVRLVGSSAPSGGLSWNGDYAGEGFFTLQNLQVSDFDAPGINITSMSENDYVTIQDNTFDGDTNGVQIVDIPTGFGFVDVDHNTIYSNNYGVYWNGQSGLALPTHPNSISYNTFGKMNGSTEAPNANAPIYLGTGVSSVNIESNSFTTNFSSGPTTTVPAIDVDNTNGTKFRMDVNSDFTNVVGPPINGGPNKLPSSASIVQSAIIYSPTADAWNIPYRLAFDQSGDFQTDFYKVTSGSGGRTTYTRLTGIRDNNISANTTVQKTLPLSGSQISDGDRIAVVTTGVNGAYTGYSSEMSSPVTITTAPRVVDVLIRSTTGDKYSFASLALGHQYDPVPYSDALRVQIKFSENVTFGQNGAGTDSTWQQRNCDPLVHYCAKPLYLHCSGQNCNLGLRVHASR